MNAKSILLTGGAGFLGSYLARDLLRAGNRVAVMCRAGIGISAFDRVREALSRIDGADPERWIVPSNLEVVEGDITLENGGLSPHDLQRLAGKIDAVIHSAALAKFASEETKLMETNSSGTEKMYRLAERLNAREFHHVGTAFVCGARRGKILESELDCRQEFRNGYESSKFSAEMFLRGLPPDGSVRVTIYRPSIIVGDTVRGFTAKYDTLYSFMRLLHCAKKGRGLRSFVVPGNGRTTKNVVPVDYVSRAIRAIVGREEWQGKTYHVVNPRPPTLDILAVWFRNIVGLDKVAVVAPKEGGAQSLAGVEMYAPYMDDEPTFDMEEMTPILRQAGIEPPIVNEPFFRKLYHFALSTGWGKHAPIARAGTAEDYFEEYLPQFLGKQLIPSLHSLNALFTVTITGDGPTPWSLRIRDGAIVEIFRNGEGEYGYETDEETFLAIAGGRLSPKRAFFSGAVKIKGNVFRALQTAVVLEEFFRMYPYGSAQIKGAAYACSTGDV